MVWRLLTIPALAVLSGMALCGPVMAGGPRPAASAAALTDISSQTRPRPARPRVRVYPQPPFWEYPRPGVYSWPGPNAKRDCRAWYVLEHRPSGAVMTPRMRCEWVPG